MILPYFIIISPSIYSFWPPENFSDEIFTYSVCKKKLTGPDVKLNSGLASIEVKTENSNVVIFVKIIKENTNEMLCTSSNKILTKLLKNKNYRTKDLFFWQNFYSVCSLISCLSFRIKISFIWVISIR